jgi:hypothetical protein
MEMESMKTTRQCMLTGMLVLIVACMLAAPVSADDAYLGTPPVTELSGTVNGGVDVLFCNTWKTTNPIDTDDAWANFTLEVNPANVDMQFAHLYVVVYSGNMTANYEGTETVEMYRNGGNAVTLADAQPLDLEYDPETGTAYNTTVSAPFTDLSRVTSDYVSVFDVKDYLTNQDIDVYVQTTNETGRFDGRIKEVKLVYGWNVTSGSSGDTQYWVNEGHDPMTKYIGTYTDNKTWFNGTTDPEEFTAELWVDYLASASGTYTWNGNAITPTVTQGTYAGLGYLTWTDEQQPPYVLENNVLTYDRSGSWYKIITAVFTLKETT